MSKENATPQGQVVEIKVLGKLTAKDLGNPKKVLALDGDSAKLTLGRIFGIVAEVKRKDVVDPKNGATTTYWPLVGQFVGVTPEGDQIRSGVLYLPSGIHDAYKTATENMQEGDSLRFAIELRSIKASNAAGYTYEAVDLMPPKVVDMLEDFKRLQAEDETKALGDGKAEKSSKKSAA